MERWGDQREEMREGDEVGRCMRKGGEELQRGVRGRKKGRRGEGGGCYTLSVSFWMRDSDFLWFISAVLKFLQNLLLIHQ